jgi:hypothetical protein
MHKDCRGVCYGNASRDDCGVCYVADDGHLPNSGKDCSGRCGGLAVVDDCGQCVLGSTGRVFNYALDCAGQCFGNRSTSDPYVLRSLLLVYSTLSLSNRETQMQSHTRARACRVQSMPV